MVATAAPATKALSRLFRSIHSITHFFTKRRGSRMPTAITRDGYIVQVEHLTRWYGRLFSLPLLAASLYLFYYVFLSLWETVAGLDSWSDNLAGLLVFSALGLAIGTPGLMVATFRYRVLVDLARRELTVTRQFGPLKFGRPRRLADFTLVSITDDGEESGTTFGVNLCGNRGTAPVLLSTFEKREAATDFAREIGTALKLPQRDLVGTEPDDPDAQSEDAALAANAAGAAASHP
jgi:hypothetical protein